MNTAIDFYSRGKEKEAEANEYTLPGYYPLGRFICPECGECVYECDWTEEGLKKFLCPICEFGEEID